MNNFLIPLLLSILCGSLVGLNREMRGRSAGLKTHILVCIGSTLFTILSTYLSSNNPARITANIVTGVGFLGAGTIIKDGFNTRGLTTAAGLWVCAAIGMAIGSSFYLVGIGVAITAMIMFVIVGILENYLFYKEESIIVLETSNTVIPEFLINLLKQRLNVTKIGYCFKNDSLTLTIRGDSRNDDLNKVVLNFKILCEQSNIPIKKLELK